MSGKSLPIGPPNDLASELTEENIDMKKKIAKQFDEAARLDILIEELKADLEMLEENGRIWRDRICTDDVEPTMRDAGFFNSVHFRDIRKRYKGVESELMERINGEIEELASRRGVEFDRFKLYGVE